MPQGFASTSGVNVYSEIQIIFDIEYGLDLGTGLPDGAEMGCLLLNVFAEDGKRIRCTLVHGINIYSPPYISITGYKRITNQPFTDITAYISGV